MTRRIPLEEGLAKGLALTAGWSDTTLIVRGDSSTQEQLALQYEANPHPVFEPSLSGWSVQAAPGKNLYYLCQPLIQAKVRTVSLGTLRAKGGRLAKTPGLHEHCTILGIDAKTLHEILTTPTRNPYGPK